MCSVIFEDGLDFGVWCMVVCELLVVGLLLVQVQWQVGGVIDLFGNIELMLFVDVLVLMVGWVLCEFMSLVDIVFVYSDLCCYVVFYCMLWWFIYGECKLLQIVIDDDVFWVYMVVKVVCCDMYKMKVFVCFCEVVGLEGVVFIVWFEFLYEIVVCVVLFFVWCFIGMCWLIFMLLCSVYWDGEMLCLDVGVDKVDVFIGDVLEDFWCIYFVNIFNLVWLKVCVMIQEMFVCYWKNLLEVVLILVLIQDVLVCMQVMVDKVLMMFQWCIFVLVKLVLVLLFEGSFVQLCEQVRQCCVCLLWQLVMQIVFGEGLDDVCIVVVGEQFGDQEDLVGWFFVGFFGELFDCVLVQFGIECYVLYIINIVKYFKFELCGKCCLYVCVNV